MVEEIFVESYNANPLHVNYDLTKDEPVVNIEFEDEPENHKVYETKRTFLTKKTFSRDVKNSKRRKS